MSNGGSRPSDKRVGGGGGGGGGHRTFCGSVYHMIQDGSVKDSETVQIKAIDHSVARRL